MKITAAVFALSLVLLSGCGAGAIVTQSEYAQLQTGMSYSQVAGAVGDPGTESQHMSVMGIDQRTYMWQNANGSNLICQFQNDKLISKTATMLP